MRTSASYSRLAAFLGVCASGAVPGIAGAQTSSTANADPSLALSEVVITGSRVVTNGNESPTPVTVVTIDDIQATRPTTVFEGLLDMPVFAGSRGAVTEMRGAGGNNNNTSVLNLRGLGSQRTLILFDGHRFPPTNQNGWTDANMIPQLLLQRVDVVTGGASAVYGSDAIGGVVNFITDRKFVGVKVNLQAGLSERRDDPSHEVGIAAGTNLFGGRGHLQASFQQHHDAGVSHRTAREHQVPRYALQGAGTADNPYFLATGTTYNNMSFGGKIVGPTTSNNTLRNMEFSSNGVLTPFIGSTKPTTGLIGNIQYGGSGAFQTASALKAKIVLNQIYSRFDFDVTDDLHYYLAASATENESSNNYLNNRIIGVTLSATNAFLPAVYQQRMAADGVTMFTFGKNWLEESVRPQHVENFARTVVINTGLEGKLGNYDWEANYTFSPSTFVSKETANLNNAKLAAALDAVLDSNNQAVCRVTLTNPGLYPGCVPLNVFGPSSESDEAAEYILGAPRFRAKNVMHDVAGSITGAPFNTWAGPVNMALSGDWRRLTYELTSEALPANYDPVSCLGLRFNCGANTTRWLVATSNRPPVTQQVSEAAVEANLPLLKDLFLAQSVDLNLAYRHARYKATGALVITDPEISREFLANTWKFGLHWKLNDTVAIRGTRSRDFHAPNLDDLFSPASITSNSGNIDVLTGITPTALAQSGGNPNLFPEIGYTTTVGIVFTPTPKFSLALDAYDITIMNAIDNAAGTSRISQNACYASGGSSFYCTLQERPVPIAAAIANPIPANTVTKWYSLPLNISSRWTTGIDLEANYKTQLFDHAFSWRTLVAYQPHVRTQTPGLNDVDYAGVTFNNANQAGAVWRVTTSLRYSPTDNVTIDWQTRWRSSLHAYGDPTIIVAGYSKDGKDRVASYSTSNLNLAYRLPTSKMQSDIYLNVLNVFDRDPSPIANTAAATEPGRTGGSAPGDDVIGRYYNLGIRIKL